MPTYERADEFLRDLLRITPEQRAQFDAAVNDMVADVKAGRPFRASLRVKKFQAIPHYYEATCILSGIALVHTTFFANADASRVPLLQ